MPSFPEPSRRLAVQFTRAKRHATVNRGEAHLPVARNRARPVDVTAGGVAFRATGIPFPVRLLEQDGDTVADRADPGRIMQRRAR